MAANQKYSIENSQLCSGQMHLIFVLDHQNELELIRWTICATESLACLDFDTPHWSCNFPALIFSSVGKTFKVMSEL